MTFDWIDAYKDPETCRALADHIRRISRKPVTLMEVCGTHTVSIFKHGIRSLLPGHVTLLSGPGCPVCVTPAGDLDAMISLCDDGDVVIATFGDLMKVPGSSGSMQEKRAQGADVRVVASVMDALALAVKYPMKKVVFAGVGFETTAPTVAVAVLEAQRTGLSNFFVYSAHKLTPPAVAAVVSGPGAPSVDGLLLPGHVSVMTGADYFRPMAEESGMSSAIAGFEPVDLLRGISELISAAESGRTVFANTYERAVTDKGNPMAMAMMNRVFQVGDSRWRGLGVIPSSGLDIAPDFSAFDAARVFGLNPVDIPDPAGCSCGEVLTGRITPPDCPLYKTRCTPIHPVGPCMVSGEGTCAAYYHYNT
jgi:hydrogenase expression/formation protein HypD